MNIKNDNIKLSFLLDESKNVKKVLKFMKKDALYLSPNDSRYDVSLYYINKKVSKELIKNYKKQNRKFETCRMTTGRGRRFAIWFNIALCIGLKGITTMSEIKQEFGKTNCYSGLRDLMQNDLIVRFKVYNEYAYVLSDKGFKCIKEKSSNVYWVILKHIVMIGFCKIFFTKIIKKFIKKYLYYLQLKNN